MLDALSLIVEGLATLRKGHVRLVRASGGPAARGLPSALSCFWRDSRRWCTASSA